MCTPSAVNSRTLVRSALAVTCTAAGVVASAFLLALVFVPTALAATSANRAEPDTPGTEQPGPPTASRAWVARVVVATDAIRKPGGGVLADPLTSIRSSSRPAACQMFSSTTGRRLSARAELVAVQPPSPPPPPPPPDAGDQLPAPPLSVAPPELGITKHSTMRDRRRRVRSGSAASWRIAVTNQGTRAAVDVRICDVLPRGLVVQRAPGAAVMSRGRVCWTVARLEPGARVAYQLKTLVVLEPTTTGCRPITNRATVEAPGATPDSSDSSLTVCRRKRPPPPGGATG